MILRNAAGGRHRQPRLRKPALLPSGSTRSNGDGSTDLASPNGGNVILKLRGEEQYCTTVNVHHYSGWVQCAFQWTGQLGSFWVSDSTNPWVPGAYLFNFYGEREWCRSLHPVPYSNTVQRTVCP
jgi:hypothetical protein